MDKNVSYRKYIFSPNLCKNQLTFGGLIKLMKFQFTSIPFISLEIENLEHCIVRYNIPCSVYLYCKFYTVHIYTVDFFVIRFLNVFMPTKAANI